MALFDLKRVLLAGGLPSNGDELAYSATLNPPEQTDISAIGLVAGATIAVRPEAGSSLELDALAKNVLNRLPAIGTTTIARGLGMMLIPSEIGQDPTIYQLDGRDDLRVKYDEDMLSGVIEQQVDGAWESTGQLVTPEYRNDDFFGGIVGFTIADDIPNASTGIPISTPLDSSTQFPALSDRERQLADPSGGFGVHEGEDIGGLVSPTPTDPSLSAPMLGYPDDSGVNPESVMMNEGSEGGNVDEPDKFGFTNLQQMDSQYIGEETGAVWGTKVKYLNVEERLQYQVQINDGKLYDAEGNLFDTSKAHSAFGGSENAIFVMDESGNIYASTVHSIGEFHHSSFLSGQPVASAGESIVEQGTVKGITRRSGHYQPTADQLNQFLERLNKGGIDLSNVEVGAGY
jgi:hypothetical protein